MKRLNLTIKPEIQEALREMAFKERTTISLIVEPHLEHLAKPYLKTKPSSKTK